MEAETQERTDVKGKAKLESSSESYGPYSPKKNASAKSIFTRLGNTIDRVQPRLRSTVERLPRERPQNEERPKSYQERAKSRHHSKEGQGPNLQITISRNDQHRIVSQKAEKGSQQLLREKYKDGDSEVGLLGESSGKFILFEAFKLSSPPYQAYWMGFGKIKG